jgi:hypothetical protein
VEVAATFEHPPSIVISMIQKLQLRAREAIGEHEEMLVVETISEDNITLDDILGVLKDAKKPGLPQVIPEGLQTHSY